MVKLRTSRNVKRLLGRSYTGYDPSQDTPYVNPEQAIENAPGYNKLTPGEKWLYKVLPNVSESGFGKALAKFNESWAGKALQYLDVGAEGLERLSGFVHQYIEASKDEQSLQEFKSSIADAWYAGSLYADMGNLPLVNISDEGVKLLVPNDLPGIDGVIRARRKLKEYVLSGMDRGEALQKVRDEYYNDIGALAIRAQVQDTFFHIFLDPLNYVMPKLRPVERLHAARIAAQTKKVPLESIELLQSTADVLKAEGKLDDAARVLQRMEDLQKTGEGLSAWDRFAITITGGNTLEPNVLNKWWNPFALTPEARAHELLSQVANHVDTYIFSNFSDPGDIMRVYNRALKGALGSEFGHAFLTAEGRIAQAAVAEAATEVQKLYEAWALTSKERTILDQLAQLTGLHQARVLQNIVDDAPGFIKSLVAKYGDDIGGLAQHLTPDVLDGMKLLEDVPYTKELFKLYASNAVKDAAAQIGVVKFGVKGKGLIQKAADFMKAGETLAFLRLNPGFAVRNFLNNVTTSIARGTYGVFSEDDVARFIDEIIGFEPHRFGQAFTMAGEGVEGAKAVGMGETVIAEAARGETKAIDELTRKIRDVKLPEWIDFGALSTKAERNASQRAFIVGYMQGMKRYFWKPGRGFTRVADYIPQEIAEKLGADMIDNLEHKIADAMATKHIDEVFDAESGVSVSKMFDDASERLGKDIDDILPTEFRAKVELAVKDALENNKPITEVFDGLRKEWRGYIDEITEKWHQQRIDYFENIVAGEGPQGFLTAWNEAVDDYMGYHLRYADEMRHLERIGQLSGDMRNKFFGQFIEESTQTWERVGNRFEAAFEGMTKGAKKLGIDVPNDVADAFKGWRKTANEFFQHRQELLDKFFEGTDETLKWEDVIADLDTRYTELVEIENKTSMLLDDEIGRLISLQNPELGESFAAWRKLVRDLRLQDRQAVVEFRRAIENLNSAEREKAWLGFWNERYRRWEQLYKIDRAGRAALQGDDVAAEALRTMAPAEGRMARFRSLYRKYGINDDKHAINAVNKYLRGEYADEVVENATQYSKITDIPEEVMQEALEARRIARGEEIVEEAAETIGKDIHTIADAKSVMGLEHSPPFMDSIEDQMMLGKGWLAIDELEQSALKQLDMPKMKFSDFDEETANWLERYANLVKGQFSDAKLASIKFAEYKRDAALLNYNRRYNFDTWLGTLMPFEFWMTHSVMKWAVESINRPAMLSTYLRMKKFMETAGAPDSGFPSRLKGMLRIPMPFLPEWMGNSVFFDPLNVLLPFDNMAYPYEEYMKQMGSKEGRAERIIEEWIKNGDVDPNEARSQLESHSGDIWERAVSWAEEEGVAENDAFDFANMFTSFHAPLVWAKEMIDGTPENIGPFTPMGRIKQYAFGMLGIDPTRQEWDLVARARRHFGLHGYDRWDEYRVERELSNMVAEGKLTADEAVRAMIEKQGEYYDEAVKRAAKEYSGGSPIATVLKMIGIPIYAYPPGEAEMRSLQDDFARAYKAYDEGDAEALRKFFDAHPEYEARLALFKEPEERMRTFLVDNIWDKYNQLPTLNKRELRDALGEEFNQLFLDKETRAIDQIPIERLQIWLKLLGGDPPGTLNSPVIKLDLTDKDKAWRVEQFYNIRKTLFPRYWEQQNEYYSKTTQGEKRAYLAQHPELEAYWDWRRDFFARNPDVVPHLDDSFDFPYSEEERQAIEQTTPNYTIEEWRAILGGSVVNVVLSGDIPEEAEEYIATLAEQIGVSYDDMINDIYVAAGK